MRFSADQYAMAHALSQVTRVIQPQNTMAVLTGVQIDAVGRSVRLSATDLTTMLTVQIPADVIDPGTVVLPAPTFNELIHRLPTAQFDCTSNPQDGRVTIRYGKSHATLHSFGEETLPEFPSPQGHICAVQVAPGTFAKTARETLFACARDESRPILKGVSLTVGDARLVFAATDGSRLSQTWFPIPDYRGDSISVVIPPKAMQELTRMGDGVEPIDVTLSQELLWAESPGITLVSRLLEGTFPDYQRVIPGTFLVKIQIAVNDLRGAVERANLIASKDSTASIRMRHTINCLEISASTPDLGKTEEILDCHSEGEDMDLLFNPHYLLDALKSFDKEEVILEFSGIQAPARLRAPEGSGYFHIVLPLRQLV